VDSTTLTFLLFVLAALFVRAAVLSAFMIVAAALLLAAGRLIVLRITSGRLMRAALIRILSAALLSLLFISVVWHIYFPPVVVVKIFGPVSE